MHAPKQMIMFKCWPPQQCTRRRIAHARKSHFNINDICLCQVNPFVHTYRHTHTRYAHTTRTCHRLRVGFINITSIHPTCAFVQPATSNQRNQSDKLIDIPRPSLPCKMCALAVVPCARALSLSLHSRNTACALHLSACALSTVCAHTDTNASWPRRDLRDMRRALSGRWSDSALVRTILQCIALRSHIRTRLITARRAAHKCLRVYMVRQSPRVVDMSTSLQ